MKWRVYFDDGMTFDSSDGEPCDVPGHGILAIVEADDTHGRVVLNGWNWYYHDGENWWGCDVHGLLDRLTARLPTYAVSQGRMAPKYVFEDTLDRAVTDPDFPIKSGPHPKDRPFQKVGWS